jgi:hypothetical protein
MDCHWNLTVRVRKQNFNRMRLCLSHKVHVSLSCGDFYGQYSRECVYEEMWRKNRWTCDEKSHVLTHNKIRKEGVRRWCDWRTLGWRVILFQLPRLSRCEMMVASFIYLFMVHFTSSSFRHCSTKWQDSLQGMNWKGYGKVRSKFNWKIFSEALW